MTTKSYQETDRFQIQTEMGDIYTAIETTEILHAETHSGIAKIRGMKSLRTGEGFHINLSGDDYAIVELGLRAKRVN